MSAIPKPPYISIKEYLGGEEISEIKHEYYNGEVFAMAGATELHDIVSMNINANLHTQLRKRSCRAYSSDMRVKVESTGLYTYPDVSVVCGKAQFENKKRNSLLNPTVIFEVLSPSTESYDRGKKFENYRTIDSLEEYVLVAQDRVYVEHYVRQSNGRWLLSEVQNVDATLQLASIECALHLADVYEDAEFDKES